METRRPRRKARTSDTTRVIGYIRCSTIEQADSGLGLESQRQKIAADCARRGWELLMIIEDAGASGKGIARKGLQEALHALKDGNAEVLMSAKLDRLSRSVKDVCQIGDMAKFYGWSLVLLDCNIDTTTPYGEAQLNMMATFAQLERRLIGVRTKEAMAIAKAQGKVISRPTIDPAIETRIKEMRNGGLNMSKIANQLNSEKVATARGGSWHPATIKLVLDRAA